MRPFSGGDAPKSRLRRLWSFTGLALLASSWLPHKSVAASAADYYVSSLPGAPEGPLLKMHAGHIEVTPESHGKLFFWHFQNRHIGDRSRTVIWLNGGPGCSSMDGALMEVGPYRVREGGSLEYNDGSWDEFANLLFVDNPVGTGFSSVDTDSYIHELNTMADQFVDFLGKWFELFPEYEKDDLYIAGESYAGEHIPYITRKILDTHYGDHVVKSWNLKGILIGNGWISPVDQYPSYLKYAYKYNLIEQGSTIGKQLDAQQAVCDRSLGAGGSDRVDTRECEGILSQMLKLTRAASGSADQACINMYDVRLRDSYPSCGMNWPPDLTFVTPYLRKPEVVSALHVSGVDKNTGWKECSSQVSGAFTARNSSPAITLLPDILKEIPVLLFSGEQDLICNHIGTEELIHNMKWNDGQGFESSPGTWAPRRKWTFEGEAAGYYQEARNLTYVLFHNASHMVPFDFPRRTRDMLDRFMGVDIGNIGGKPTDSRLDGEKGIETSVGGHPNSTAAEEEEHKKLEEATWNAYYKSGEVVLIIVAIAAAAWGWFVYRDRRKRAGYRSVSGDTNSSANGRAHRGSMNGGARLENFRHKGERTDIEAYGDDDADDYEHKQGREGRETYSMGNMDPESDRAGHAQQWHYKDR